MSSTLTSTTNTNPVTPPLRYRIGFSKVQTELCFTELESADARKEMYQLLQRVAREEKVEENDDDDRSSSSQNIITTTTTTIPYGRDRITSYHLSQYFSTPELNQTLANGDYHQLNGALLYRIVDTVNRKQLFGDLKQLNFEDFVYEIYDSYFDDYCVVVHPEMPIPSNANIRFKVNYMRNVFRYVSLVNPSSSSTSSLNVNVDTEIKNDVGYENSKNPSTENRNDEGSPSRSPSSHSSSSSMMKFCSSRVIYHNPTLVPVKYGAVQLVKKKIKEQDINKNVKNMIVNDTKNKVSKVVKNTKESTNHKPTTPFLNSTATATVVNVLADDVPPQKFPLQKSKNQYQSPLPLPPPPPPPRQPSSLSLPPLSRTQCQLFRSIVKCLRTESTLRTIQRYHQRRQKKVQQQHECSRKNDNGGNGDENGNVDADADNVKHLYSVIWSIVADKCCNGGGGGFSSSGNNGGGGGGKGGGVGKKGQGHHHHSNLYREERIITATTDSNDNNNNNNYHKKKMNVGGDDWNDESDVINHFAVAGSSSSQQQQNHHQQLMCKCQNLYHQIVCVQYRDTLQLAENYLDATQKFVLFNFVHTKVMAIYYLFQDLKIFPLNINNGGGGGSGGGAKVWENICGIHQCNVDLNTLIMARNIFRDRQTTPSIGSGGGGGCDGTSK